ncbi:hypothetical protein M378DRAFT_15703 [Amanita muscaria Koide BX008]|uniref:Uncharacterized protein n=1 Tax=Amanita muscaria (strain Koide BX008) TaxID=946122 RepID=A0A0C2WPL6_AMAMK|nr:hypothetical protein M378DRAFT_15703 [Amanita muscaria Koide BX008]
MSEQIDHPPDYKECSCTHLCDGSKWVHEQTYRRHEPYRDKDIARRREELHAKVTHTRTLARAGLATSRNYHDQLLKKPPKLAHHIHRPEQCNPVPPSPPLPNISSITEPDRPLLSNVPSITESDPIPFQIDLDSWHEELEEQEYNPDEDGGDDLEEEDGEEGVQPRTATDNADDEPLPRATLPTLMLVQKLIDCLKDAKLEDDIKDPKLLHSI